VVGQPIASTTGDTRELAGQGQSFSKASVQMAVWLNEEFHHPVAR